MWRLMGGRLRLGAACVGPLAALGHTSPIAHCTLSKHDAASHAKKEEERRKQYAEAMACVASGQCTAYGASKMLADASSRCVGRSFLGVG